MRVVKMLCGCALMGFMGCNSGEFPVSKVTGKVTCQGKPVPFALIFFEPLRSGESAITGKQGLGECNENGEFSVTTYNKNDGAVVGKHIVHVMPPHAEDHPGLKRCPCEFNSATQKIEVEVKSDGVNEFTFALPVLKSKPAMTADEREAMEEAKINQAK